MKKKILAYIIIIALTFSGCSQTQGEVIPETIVYDGDLNVEVTGTYYEHNKKHLVTLQFEYYEDGKGQYIETTYLNAKNEIRQGDFELDGETLIDKVNDIEFKLGEREIKLNENDLSRTFKKQSNLLYKDFLLSNGINKGMLYADLKTLLALESDPEPPSGQWNSSSFEHNGMVIGLHSNEETLDNAKVSDYHLTNPEIDTYRGIRVGSTVEEINEKYGTLPNSESSDFKIYRLEQYQLIFDTKDGKVIEIICQLKF